MTIFGGVRPQGAPANGPQSNPGPGAYLRAGGDSRTTGHLLDSTFGTNHPDLKYTRTVGAAIGKSTDCGWGRAYWAKGVITDRGLMYLPLNDGHKFGPAQHNLSGQIFDGRKPAFAPLKEGHLRPKETFGKERRFRAEERRGVIKSGIHDLVLPGPGEYLRPHEKHRRSVENYNTAPADGHLHPSMARSSECTAFLGTATGINVDPAMRCDTPRGRTSWIRGAILEGKNGAPDVGTQTRVETSGVACDMWADLSRSSSFLHGSFNTKGQINARTPLRTNVLDKAMRDSRGRPKMDRFSAQPLHLTRNSNAMT